MAATTALGSSWALESGSLEHTFTVARADSDEPGSAGAEGLRDSEEAGSADAQGVRDSGPLWCTLRKGEGGEDAPCHVAGEWVDQRSFRPLPFLELSFTQRPWVLRR